MRSTRIGQRRALRTLALVLVAVFGVAACEDSTEPAPSTLVLSFTGLEPLANGYHYEGWALVGGVAEPTGKFNVDGAGRLITLDGAVISGGAFETGLDLTGTTDVVITIEPAGDVDDIPASTHIVAGSVTGGSAQLTVGHAGALGDDFGESAGSFILATPTDDVPDNERAGIWFLTLESGMPEAGLTLPTLPAGWAYEGWAVIDGVPVTTGRFTAVDMADDRAPYSGPLPGPPFPGEDFLMGSPGGLTFPADLAGATAVITIEPEPDDSPAPFTFKPLVAEIAGDAPVHTTLALGQNLGSFPTGSATIR